jgi:hypothetical protein
MEYQLLTDNLFDSSGETVVIKIPRHPNSKSARTTVKPVRDHSLVAIVINNASNARLELTIPILSPYDSCDPMWVISYINLGGNLWICTKQGLPLDMLKYDVQLVCDGCPKELIYVPRTQKLCEESQYLTHTISGNRDVYIHVSSRIIEVASSSLRKPTSIPVIVKNETDTLNTKEPKAEELKIDRSSEPPLINSPYNTMGKSYMSVKDYWAIKPPSEVPVAKITNEPPNNNGAVCEEFSNIKELMHNNSETTKVVKEVEEKKCIQSMIEPPLYSGGYNPLETAYTESPLKPFSVWEPVTALNNTPIETCLTEMGYVQLAKEVAQELERDPCTHPSERASRNLPVYTPHISNRQPGLTGGSKVRIHRNLRGTSH